tara:strand:+ start:60 stop:314 length:255 start_codon:yes stop_codon:yes gene_type:complete
MIYYIVAVLFLADPFVPHMIFNKEVFFYDEEVCKQYIVKNGERLQSTIMRDFGHLKIESFSISCIDEEKHEYYKGFYGKKGTET